VIDVEKLKEARVKAGLTQDELARRVGITQTHISKIEKDNVAPSTETLGAILEVLGLPIESVWVQNPNPPQPPAPDERERNPEPGAEGKPAA
jgi:DNA-binding XRE family transcriptional regulator